MSLVASRVEAWEVAVHLLSVLGAAGGILKVAWTAVAKATRACEKVTYWDGSMIIFHISH